jgi:hypothetical protein
LRVKSILRNSQQTSFLRSPSTPEPPTQCAVQPAVKHPLALNTTTVAIARGSTPPPLTPTSGDPPAQPTRKEKKHKAKQGNKYEANFGFYAVHFFYMFFFLPRRPEKSRLDCRRSMPSCWSCWASRFPLPRFSQSKFLPHLTK